MERIPVSTDKFAKGEPMEKWCRHWKRQDCWLWRVRSGGTVMRALSAKSHPG